MADRQRNRHAAAAHCLAAKAAAGLDVSGKGRERVVETGFGRQRGRPMSERAGGRRAGIAECGTAAQIGIASCRAGYRNGSPEPRVQEFETCKWIRAAGRSDRRAG